MAKKKNTGEVVVAKCGHKFEQTEITASRLHRAWRHHGSGNFEE